MILDEREPFGLRALRAFDSFGGPQGARVEKLHDVYLDVSRRWMDHLVERATLIEVVWRTEDPDALGWLIGRIEKLSGMIETTYAAIEETIALAATVRNQAMFANDGFSAWRTLAAIVEGNSGEKIDEPLPADHTAKLRERYRARRGLG